MTSTPQPCKISRSNAHAILFVEGFVSVAIQILLLRQLVPFVGSNIIITSIVIGMFLAVLAIGYAIGGRQLSNPSQTLSRNLLIAALISSIVYSYTFTEAVFNTTEHLNLYGQTIIYLCLSLVPTIFLMAQTIPILSESIGRDSVSSKTGAALSLNTLGSVLGAIITSTVCFHFLGVSETLILCTSLLLISCIRISGTALFLITIIITSYCNIELNYKNTHERFITTTAYGNYAVVDTPLLRVLEINRAAQSGIWANGQPLTYNYQVLDLWSNLGLMKSESEILVLGAGGFTISMNDRINQYTYVDIDEKLQKIAETHFLKDKVNGDYIVSDARLILKDLPNEHYEAIFIDLFSHKGNTPWHLATKEFFDQVNNKLKEDGYVTINAIALPKFKDSYSQRTHNTINHSFGHCYTIPLFQPGDARHNLIYACSKKTNQTSNRVYTDKTNHGEIDAALSDW
ncbi:fused MFS/spermidine synthase [Vibrio breoganii]